MTELTDFFYSEIWQADFQLLCEQFGTNDSEVFSSRLKIGFVDMWPAGSTLRLSGVSNKSQNNFVAVQSLSLKKQKHL